MAMALAIFLAAMMLLGIVALIVDTLISPASAAPRVTQAQIDEQRRAAQAHAAERARVQAQITQLHTDRASAIRQKNAYEQMINITEEEIRHTEILLDMLADQILEKEEEIEEAIGHEREAYRLYLQRIRAAEEQPAAVYLGILLMSENIMDFMTRLDNMTDILRYDDNVRDRLENARAVLEGLKAALEDDQAYQLSVQENLEASRADLIRQSDRVQELIDDLTGEIASNSAHAADLQRQENEANARSAALAAELERQRNLYVGGDYLWPVPGHTNITSYFGNRTHPILRTPSRHTGIDIGAPGGARVVAANRGTVLESGWCNIYGNYIIINHGGGRATKYAHLRVRNVNRGQEVTRGQTIGQVGSTGLSTGPHLHFEWWRDGEPRNPINNIFWRNQ
jgi:murein DD-endopeptidase MepM/ murein hydrolase activator NlpD